MKRIVFLVTIFSFFFFFTNNQAEATHPDTPNEQILIINKNVNKLAFYDHGVLVKSFPVATGRDSSLTPEGTYEITKLVRNMPYYKTNIAGGDPNNPLGDRWIGLNVPGTQGYTYGIHGTNMEWTIGTYASSGCVRMYNEEVRWLYDKLYYGAKVVILRSDLTFDEIAENNGYKVEKSIPFEHDITLLKETKGFTEHNFYSSFNTIQKGVLRTSEKAGNWIMVDFNGEKRWIHTKQYAIGKITVKERELFLGSEENIFSSPENPDITGTVAPGILTSFEETDDGWYHINTSTKGDVWIKSSSIEFPIFPSYEKKEISDKESSFIGKITLFFDNILQWVENLF